MYRGGGGRAGGIGCDSRRGTGAKDGVGSREDGKRRCRETLEGGRGGKEGEDDDASRLFAVAARGGGGAGSLVWLVPDLAG